jgi:hypothetical protein
MAEIVLGIGTSHSPLLILEGHEWHARAAADYENPKLTLSDGRDVGYEQLVAERGERFHDVAVPQVFNEIAERCHAGLDRLADEIALAAPDVVVIVGDDQGELYTEGNIPAIAMFRGAEIVTHPWTGDLPPWMSRVAATYGMDEIRRFAAHPELAGELISGLIERAVDLAVCTDVPNPEVAGFGHAFGFPIQRLFRGKAIPIVPIMLNTYFPPNVPTAARCHDIGRALREAIEASSLELRVAVLASGGLSHFVVDEDLDRLVLDNLGSEGAQQLRAIPSQALREGSSEILNWILTAGAVSHLPVQWVEYEPIHRTAGGTGVGIGFAVWRD